MAEVVWPEPALSDLDSIADYIAPPCRVFYRHDNRTVFILHVMRAERLLRRRSLTGPGRTLVKRGVRARQKPPPDKVTDEQ